MGNCVGVIFFQLVPVKTASRQSVDMNLNLPTDLTTQEAWNMLIVKVTTT